MPQRADEGVAAGGDQDVGVGAGWVGRGWRWLGRDTNARPVRALVDFGTLTSAGALAERAGGAVRMTPGVALVAYWAGVLRTAIALCEARVSARTSNVCTNQPCIFCFVTEEDGCMLRSLVAVFCFCVLRSVAELRGVV